MKVKKYYDEGFNVFNLTLQFKEKCVFPSMIAVDIYNVLIKIEGLRENLDVILTHPSLFENPSEDERQFNFFIASKLYKAELIPVIQSNLTAYVEYLSKVTIAKHVENIIDERDGPEDESEESLETAEEEQVKDVKFKSADTIRIDVKKIEELGNLVGEMISSKVEIDAYISTLLSQGTYQRSVFNKLKKANKHLGNVVDRLRDLSLETRMVQVSTVFRRFPRMVRDLAKEKGKDIKFVLQGEECKVDKTIIEEINDPIIHILRNSIDHGIENTEERMQKQKNPQGRIILKAYNEGNSIIIEVEDDGKGLDVEKIKSKALDKGLISQERVDKVSDKEALNFIFLPGFSTAEAITEISGRGVGLDVVRSHVEKLNGIIHVDSKPNQGVKFTLKLPLTLAIIQVLLAKDKDEIYAIPFYSILETANFDKSKIRTYGQYSIIDKDDETIPIFRLADLYENKNPVESETPYFIELVVSLGHYAIAVEDILGQQEIVIKSLGGYLGKVEGISGATILSDGRITLVVDVKSLSEMIATRMDNNKELT